MSEILLRPCPFCGGPPVLGAYNPDDEGAGAFDHKKIGNGVWMVVSYVSCHECGAQSEEVEEFCIDMENFYDLLRSAVHKWQERNERNIDLYDKLASTICIETEFS